MTKSVVMLPTFESQIGPIIESFITEKLACGLVYQSGIQSLKRLDRHITNHHWNECSFPKHLVLDWTCKRENESLKTQQERFYITRQFAEYMRNRGYRAYVPDVKLKPVQHRSFAPYIFSHNQLKELFFEADNMTPSSRSPFRHVVIPELFRLLYGTGMRLGEALRLTLADADLEEGVLTIRNSKFGKDRLIPLAPEFANRLHTFQQKLGKRIPTASFFPKPDGEKYGNRAIYSFFRVLIQRIGIPHQGRGKGPRLHDLRHTFAVHRMMKWLQEGHDLTAMLPILSTYLGHKGLNETQHYLHFTLEMAATLSSNLDETYGHIVPGRDQS